MLKFHFDENVHGAIARGLRRRGIDVSLPMEAELRSAVDPSHLEYAIVNERVLVTNDTDFFHLHRLNPDHCGIVFWFPETRSVGEVVEYLQIMAHCCDIEEMQGKFEFLPSSNREKSQEL